VDELSQNPDDSRCFDSLHANMSMPQHGMGPNPSIMLQLHPSKANMTKLHFDSLLEEDLHGQG
jgi:hypothetical protein